MPTRISRFLKSRSGATAIEYGLIVAVLSLAIVAGVGTAGNALEYLWSDNNSRIVQGLNVSSLLPAARGLPARWPARPSPSPA